MDKEYLENYSEKEVELNKKFIDDLIAGKLGEGTFYPSLDRFPRISEPIATAQYGSVYSIIPFYGTTIIPISSTYKHNLKFVHGFEASEIENLVDFAKDTGKIQFVLADNPIYFEGLDYYDSIFKELNPPSYLGIPPELYIPPEAFKEYQIEFETIAEMGFIDNIKSVFSTSTPHHALKESLVYDITRIYVLAKYLGFNELTDHILTLMLENHVEALRLFTIIDFFILRPNTSPLKAIRNYGTNIISRITPQEDVSKSVTERYVDKYTFSYDIGKFLINKLTYMPGDFESCKSVIELYDQTDLHRLLLNINNGLESKKSEVIMENKEDLELLLDDIWGEADSISRRMGIAKVGIPVSLAAIGTLLSGPIGLAGGVLAAIGYAVGDELLGTKTDKFSEIIGKYGRENYLVGIFDFKSKYSGKLPRM